MTINEYLSLLVYHVVILNVRVQVLNCNREDISALIPSNMKYGAPVVKRQHYDFDNNVYNYVDWQHILINCMCENCFSVIYTRDFTNSL